MDPPHVLPGVCFMCVRIVPSGSPGLAPNGVTLPPGFCPGASARLFVPAPCLQPSYRAGHRTSRRENGSTRPIPATTALDAIPCINPSARIAHSAQPSRCSGRSTRLASSLLVILHGTGSNSSGSSISEATLPSRSSMAGPEWLKLESGVGPPLQAATHSC